MDIPKEERQIQIDSARKTLNLAYKDYGCQHPASYCSIMGLEILMSIPADSELVTIKNLYTGLSAQISPSWYRWIGRQIRNNGWQLYSMMG